MSLSRRLGGPDARRRRHRLALVGAAALLVVAGALWFLGGDEGDEGDSGADRDTLLAACAESNESIGAAQRALLGGNDAPNAVEGFLGDAFVDLVRDRTAAARAVGPSGDVEAVLQDQDAVIDEIERDPAAAAGSVTNPFEAVNQRWRELGLAACAIDASTVPA
ncbi:MAG: hypothetical protein M3527_09705 [Actinomycetota bacterium]|nr:hypothetical protein [Acidimicrobiia bacterium]MDQ3294705.1 hypothetical protein [Actinomycetota bacterium]